MLTNGNFMGRCPVLPLVILEENSRRNYGVFLPGKRCRMAMI
jgi:hypothetical protein